MTTASPASLPDWPHKSTPALALDEDAHTGTVQLPGDQFAVPGQQRRGCHREDPGPLPPRDEWGQRGEPGPVGRLVTYPAGVPAQHCVLVPEHQQFGVLRLVAAEYKHNQAE